MGLQIETITNETEYNEYKDYYNSIYELYRQNPHIEDLLNILNEIKEQINIWENK